jgi:NAD(P)-dependent dehydrogenase (short-subunit alcohol dehydrogenase family)
VNVSEPKVWFITGASRGFGRQWAIAALDRGDRVALTARDAAAVADLVERYGDHAYALPLDVTDRDAAFDRMRQAHERFGRIDVLVNNAGYGHFGMVEEITEDEARAQLETNVLGALWVTQAALPYLRQQQDGHIIQVSSIGGVTAFASVGMYHASKWALEGFSQSLALEVASFGISVTIVEPTAYDTDWAGSSAVHSKQLPEYDDVRAEVARARLRRVPVKGDPEATRAAILAVVDAPQAPLRIFFGDGALATTTADYESRLATWREWEPVSIAAHGLAGA